ncbi:MAG: DNA polymerase III subunit delta [Deltaproteobacteria bacterium GWA2_38_16]|nr:MAG: DNA polymerase III subunit delta [Deltaproteobacteria bacterium GWA2_38_16]
MASPSFESLRDRIQKKIGPVYFLIDETQFFSKHLILEVKKKFLKKVTSENCRTFSSETISLETLEEEINAISLFTPQKLFIFTDADRMLKNTALWFSELFKKEIKEYCFVFVASKKSSHALSRFCEKEECLFEFKKPYESQVGHWIEWIGKYYQKTISPVASVLLQEKAGGDLLVLESEIEKLSIYVGDQKNITEEDVKDLLYETRTHSIFELLDYLGNRKKDKTLIVLYKMLEEGESEIFIFTMVLRYLRNLWKAVEWKSQKSDVEVQKLLGIHPFFWNEFRKQRDQALKLPFERYWEKALETDHLLKSVNINKKDILINFVNTL